MNFRFSSAMMISLAVMMLLPSLPLMSFGGDELAEARLNTSADAAGYSWIDSRDPDPKIEYEWIDATGGTAIKSLFRYAYSYYDTYYAMGTSFINLPFQFPFYGDKYSQIIVWPSGVMAFQDTSNGYAYYATTSAGAWPNTYSDYYSPANAIAPWWRYYGSVQMSGTDAQVYTLSGTTDEGVNYWVCEWHNVQIYYPYNYGTGYYQIYSGDNKVTYQAVLYENGDIRFNYQDVTASTVYYTYNNGAYSSSTTMLTSYHRGGTYGLVGVQNKDRNIGLTYAYNTGGSLSDGMSVLIKQFKTKISDVELSPGFGPDEKTYPARGGEGGYYLRAKLYCERGISLLDQFKFTVGSKGGEGIEIAYNFRTGAITKVNDDLRLMVVDESRSRIIVNASDDVNLTIEIYYDFNLWWGNYDDIPVRLDLVGTGVAPSAVEIDDAFRVESRIRMNGNLIVQDSRGRVIPNTGWVSGYETLRFSGVHREYLNLGPEIVPPSYVKIGVIDQTGVRTLNDASPDLDISIIADPIYPQLTYTLFIENLTIGHDLTPLEFRKEFNVRIDSDLPGIPGDLVIFADSLEESPRDFDNDPNVYITWTDAVDASSGVAYYYISVNKPRAQVQAGDLEAIPKGTNAWEVRDIPEGVNRIYMWTEDVVGNVGSEVFTYVTIDMSKVYFEGFFPRSGVWITNLRPACSVWVNDTYSGVDPLTIEYEISTEGEAALTGDWDPIQETYTPDTSLYIVVTGYFKNGKDNWIKFRATDVAENEPAESDAYNVWIDASPPTYKLKGPSELDSHLNPVQTVTVTISDLDSGIDFGSIEYRVSTNGRLKFGPWVPYKDATGDNKNVDLVVRQEFSRGELNYIQVRAKDLAGNPASTSQMYNVKINQHPRIVVLSPAPDEIYYEGNMLQFDAIPSFDPDGEVVTVSWFRPGSTSLEQFGEGAVLTTDKFDAGQYTITVIARAGQLESKYVFTLTIHPVRDVDTGTGDTDLDGMEDWWEDAWGTDKFIRDSDKDPDADGFTNMQEYDNQTNPVDKESHPPSYVPAAVEAKYGLLDGNMWLLIVVLAIMVVAVLATMFVAKSKKDKAARNALASASGPALPAVPLSPDQTLPPAPESATSVPSDQPPQ